jgi:hypothetical protein
MKMPITRICSLTENGSTASFSDRLFVEWENSN